MKKNILSLSALALTLLLLVSCVSIPDDLTAIESPNVDISISRGAAMAHSTSAPLEVYLIGNNIDSGVGSLFMSITNTSKDPYNLQDSDITIWAGNSPTGAWRRIVTWDAKAFYDAAVKTYKADVFWTAFAGVLNTFNASMGSYSSSNVYTSYGSATVTTRSYNPGAVAATAYYAQASTEAVEKSGKAYIDFLESNLLFSSSIKPSETYIGWVYFETGRDSANYYKVELRNPKTNKTMVFVLQRSEK